MIYSQIHLKFSEEESFVNNNFQCRRMKSKMNSDSEKKEVMLMIRKHNSSFTFDEEHQLTRLVFNNDRCLMLLVECHKEHKECFVSFVRKNYFANATSNTNQVVSTENTNAIDNATSNANQVVSTENNNAIANATSNTKQVATPEKTNQKKHKTNNECSNAGDSTTSNDEKF